MGRKKETTKPLRIRQMPPIERNLCIYLPINNRRKFIILHIMF